MPATSPEAIERKRQRMFERRKERRRDDPDFTRRETRQRAKRSRSPTAIEARERTRAKARELADARPFVGCDGEGIGQGAEQKYALFRMGDRELYDGDRRLTTPELLRFILDHPSRDDILIAFAFDYDVNMILRDMPTDRWRHLLKLVEKPQQYDAHVRDWRRSKSRLGYKPIADDPIVAPNPYEQQGWTWVRFPGGAMTFGVQYIPRNYLRVCRGLSVRTRRGEWRTYSMPGTTRTIYDSFGNFQSSFLAALNRWNVGAEHWSAIKAGKDARGTVAFNRITPAIRRYCAIECDLLADLMGEFRSACLAGGIRPQTWNGAGKLAAALMRDHGVMRSADVAKHCAAGLLTMAHEAYYGGRFEVTRCGLVDRPVDEFDIKSAYPAAMRELPCLDHGKWHKRTGGELQRLLDYSDARTKHRLAPALFVANVHFRHRPGTFLCGLPYRSHKDGRLSWPIEGRGVYWSPEIRSAEQLGAKVKLGDGWLYEKRCDCQPFDWIEKLYDYRRQLGPARGQPLKLGYNSIYGKWAQRIGHPPFANPIFAGLCTALTRAALNLAIHATGDPRRVVMLATDAIYTIGKPPKLDQGDGLGQWEHKRHRNLFIVRPGLYWPPKPRGKARAIKSRGVSAKFFEHPKVIRKFRRVWSDYVRAKQSGRGADLFLARMLDGHVRPIRPPVVQITIEAFIGHRLALHQGKPELACQWITAPRNQSFECHNSGKRSPGRIQGKAMILLPLRGDDRFKSATYQPATLLATADAFEDDRMLFEAMPDPVELSPPFVDG